LRRIPLSHRSHIIGSQALVTGVAEHESALERDFVTLASFSDEGAVVKAQPVTIRFEHAGKNRRYTPDFCIDWSAGSVDLVEVKYRADLRMDWSRLRPAFVAARSWAREHGMRFRIATERGIRGPRLEAAKRLLPLRTVPIDMALAELAIARAQGGGLAFISLVDALPTTREASLAVVWRLIARGALTVDLSAPIVPDTFVRAS
jgi:hypothetical protein